jgi:hypothetical protein
MPAPAQLHESASPEWAALRVWAAEMRDSATSLVAILDAFHCHKKAPVLAENLWKTALLIRDALRFKQQPVVPK